MNDYHGPLTPDDYTEPKCLLGTEQYGKGPDIKRVPQRRIVDKVNEYMSRRDYAAVERHLAYWLEEAKLGHDMQGELSIRNELIGHYRKTGNREKARENIEEALKLVEALELEETKSAAITLINAGTACNAFDDNERAMELFEKAAEIIEAGHPDPATAGGLYNNMALTCVSLGDYKRAYELYDKALAVMAEVENGELEQAITLLNTANAKEYELGLEEAEEEISDLCEKAYELLVKEGIPRDGYYAFVCEKCAPTFSYYGFFADAADLKQWAEEIYQKSVN